jgi:pSer/pThr/pTyr-binding forkhead associated (FHA) protein
MSATHEAPHAAGEPCCGACASANDPASKPALRGAPLVLADAQQVQISQQGADAPRTFTLAPQSAITVGRGAACDLVLRDDKISRQQCRVFANGSTLTIEDLGSGCGTFVNGERVQRTTLHAGDRILVGDSVLRVSLTTA